MLEIKGKIHDRYTLEFKMGISHTDADRSVSGFSMSTWIFIPDTLYINPKTYTKSNFFRDVRSVVRLITPSYTLAEISNPVNLPLQRLRISCDELVDSMDSESIKAYEHQIKMFASIVRSSLRSELQKISEQTSARVIKRRLDIAVSLLSDIFDKYRQIGANAGIASVQGEYKHYFRLGAEYMFNVSDMHLFRFLDHLRERFPQEAEDIGKSAFAFLDRERQFQQEHMFLLPEDDDEDHNTSFLYRAGQIKKYIESDLYILAHKRSNTFVLKQMFFMLAAGISMVFATVISFSFQITYGNFTMPLFIALVVSYMFKDRFKDLMHYWYASKLGGKFYDYKFKLALHGEHIGWGKEGCDFVHEDKLPLEVRLQRGRVSSLEAGNCSLKESVIVYRHKVALYGDRLHSLSHHPLNGVNEIIRVNIREFLRRMDNPYTSIYVNDGNGKFHQQKARKVYYVHFVMRISYHGNISYRRFKVCLNRRGIVNIKEW